MKRVRTFSLSVFSFCTFLIPISYMCYDWRDEILITLHSIRFVVFYYPFFSGNVLDNCDGRVISNNNIYVDFGLIKYQCSCSFTKALNVQFIYVLSRNPGHDGCVTPIQISEINGDIYRIQCMSSIPPLVISSQSTNVELVSSDPSKCDTAYEYCLTVCISKIYFFNYLLF